MPKILQSVIGAYMNFKAWLHQTQNCGGFLILEFIFTQHTIKFVMIKSNTKQFYNNKQCSYLCMSMIDKHRGYFSLPGIFLESFTKEIFLSALTEKVFSA